MALQNISEQFLDFIQDQEINVPEDFIQIFYTSISLDQWISSELAQKYLEYTRKDNFNKALNKFVIKQDYLEISKEEYQQKYKQIDDQMNHSTRSDTISKQKQQSNLRKYYLLSADCFKSMLLMRDSEKGKKYRAYMLTLEKIFKQFMIYLQNKQNDHIENQNQIIENKDKQLEKKSLQAERRQQKLILSLQQNQQLEQYYQQELQERDQQQLQLEAENEELNNQIDQQIHRFTVLSIFRENPEQPQIVCLSSNIQEAITRYTKLLNEFYEEQNNYNVQIIQKNLTRQQANQLKQETIFRLTGQQKIQHRNLQSIIPLFE